MSEARNNEAKGEARNNEAKGEARNNEAKGEARNNEAKGEERNDEAKSEERNDEAKSEERNDAQSIIEICETCDSQVIGIYGQRCTGKTMLCNYLVQKLENTYKGILVLEVGNDCDTIQEFIDRYGADDKILVVIDEILNFGKHQFQLPTGPNLSYIVSSRTGFRLPKYLNVFCFAASTLRNEFAQKPVNKRIIRDFGISNTHLYDIVQHVRDAEAYTFGIVYKTLNGAISVTTLKVPNI